MWYKLLSPGALACATFLALPSNFTSDTEDLTPNWVSNQGMEPSPLQRSNTLSGLPSSMRDNLLPPHSSVGSVRVSLDRAGADGISSLTTPSALSAGLPPLLSTRKALKPHAFIHTM